MKGITTARAATHQITDASTGCASGQTASLGTAVGLPNSVRTAAATALIGFHSATCRSQSGNVPVPTKALEMKESYDAQGDPNMACARPWSA